MKTLKTRFYKDNKKCKKRFLHLGFNVKASMYVTLFCPVYKKVLVSAMLNPLLSSAPPAHFAPLASSAPIR